MEKFQEKSQNMEEQHGDTKKKWLGMTIEKHSCHHHHTMTTTTYNAFENTEIREILR